MLRPLLFLLYNNDLPNTSSKLILRIFADDTNIFYSSNDSEFGNVLNYCAANMLSINFKKTNRMKKKTNRIE